MTQSGGAGTAATIDGSGFVRTTTNQSIAGNKTFTGTTTLGATSVSSGQTLTAGAGTTTGTGTTSGVNVAVASGLTTGTLLNVDTGTSAFSGNAVNFTSSGDFTGTLVQLTADTTTAGTVLGLHTNALTTGAVINANLGSSIYTGSAGALRLTANSASTGTLLAISGTTLAANGGTAAQITLGTPGGTANTDGKGVSILLGAVGDAYYADASSSAVNFTRFQVAGVDVFNVSGTAITTTDNFAQTGGATFSTGTGNISLNGNIVTNIAQTGTTTFSTGTGGITLNGDTTVAAGKSISALAGAGKFDFHLATSTFDTSTGNVTLNGNTATANLVTFTAGAGIVNATNAVTVTTGLLTTGSAIKVDVGASAPTTQNSTQGLGLDITGSGAFAGLSNVASLAHITSTGNFTGTLEKLTADSTAGGTVVGISAAALATGKAIDVQLAATYTGTGAVNVSGAAFSGNLLNVSASQDATTSTASLVNFSAPLIKGHVLTLAATGVYTGTGVLNLDLTTGATSGTGIFVNTAAGYSGRFIDLQLNSVSKFSVDPTTNGIQTALNFAQTGSTTFSTGTGNISLNGNVVTNIAQTGSTTFSTGTGNISLNGNVVTSITQTGATNFSTGTGTVTLNGNTSIVSGKTLTVGGGTAIKVVEIGTCTEAIAANSFPCVTGTTTITLANLLTTDTILISQKSGTTGIGCFVTAVSAGTSFTIGCQTKPGAGAVFNVMVVRQ